MTDPEVFLLAHRLQIRLTDPEPIRKDFPQEPGSQGLRHRVESLVQGAVTVSAFFYIGHLAGSLL